MSQKQYALATGGGVFFDSETGLKVLPNKFVSIDKDNAGAKTNQAILSGGLVEVTEEKTSSKSEKKTESDLPEDLPGREAFIAAGMNFDAVKAFNFETGKVAGVGAGTIKALNEYSKKQG